MPKLVAIINVTPDSFSDGGQTLSPADALAAVVSVLNDGADIIDIGAESTRPGATPISASDEWGRLAPVLEGITALDVPFSVDTRHALTATKSLIFGANWINDVSGFENPDMVAVVRDSNCKLVVMHSLSIPADKSVVMQEEDVVQALLVWARARLALLEKSGIARERIIFDPGIGFGKTAQQSRSIIDNIKEFKSLGVPIMVGHSRKSFLGGALEERDAKTLEVSRFLAAQGVDYLRVHDIAGHKAAL
jgi:dihydropteroate synthase